MRKTFLLILLVISCSGFAESITSGSSINSNVIKKQINNSSKLEVDQPVTNKKLVGTDKNTWTPEYLSVRDFKKCLAVQDYRGWQGYCLPEEQPKDCPDDSWDKLEEMNLVPCTKN